MDAAKGMGASGGIAEASRLGIQTTCRSTEAGATCFFKGASRLQETVFRIVKVHMTGGSSHGALRNSPELFKTSPGAPVALTS
eukprot:15333608-Alexandrium_andersonii.AAC.1